ncbi:hypothetical protein ABMY26_13655 [Azospirillum sp. HJ39]|uniref:hypothetical protein n=1 Tax=Azospirillum sp. HJ39 TaxID=3159496 RepID=UPI003557C21C
MTASYLVEILDWGLHLRLQGALPVEVRDNIARQVEIQCANLAARSTPWSSLVEFDHFEADGFRPEIVVALMKLARRCGHVRSAVVMTDWHWASVMAETMIAAGIDDQARIFVQAAGGPGEALTGEPQAGDLAGLDSAMAWVLYGGAVPMVSKAA